MDPTLTGGAVAAGLLAVVTIFVFFGNAKPAVPPMKLEPRVYSFEDFQKAVVAAVTPLGFSPAVILAGDLFVKPKPDSGKPTRPDGDGLFEGDVNLAPVEGKSQCVLLNLGDSVPAAGGGGGGAAAPSAGDKRLRDLEDTVQQQAAALKALEEERKKAKKVPSKAFSKVGLDEVKTILKGAGVIEGPKLALPAEVVEEAATITLEPDLPYAWGEDEKEPDATPSFLAILSSRIGHNVVDSKSVVLPPVDTEEFHYNGFTDGAVLPAGYEASTTFVLPNAAAFLEFKEPGDFGKPSEHVPQSLLELLVTQRPVFTTDMNKGFKVWVLRGTIFHPYHGNSLLTLQEGIALLRHFARLADAEAQARLAAAAAGGGGPGGSGSGSDEPAGGDSAAGGQPSGGLGGPPAPSPSGPSVPQEPATGGASGRERKASAETESGDEGTPIESESGDEGPPTDYDEYKLRALMFAQVLRGNGVAVPDSLLAGLG